MQKSWDIGSATAYSAKSICSDLNSFVSAVQRTDMGNKTHEIRQRKLKNCTQGKTKMKHHKQFKFKFE